MDLPPSPPPRVRDPSRSLGVAIAMDGSVCLAKLAAYLMTGSAAMLSESLHSAADVANQGLLVIGIRASRRPPDPRHPYGHGRARPFWALMSASGVLFIGAGATLWNGLGRLVDPHPLQRLDLALLVLAIGFASEAASFTVAIRALLRKARATKRPLSEILRRTGDPVLVAIVAEDSAGIVGVLVAAAGIALSRLLGNPLYDALGAILVGLVMASSALFLIDRNRQLLVGVGVPADRREALLTALRSNPLVRGVHDVKATQLDEHTIRFKAEIDLDGAALADEWVEAHGLEPVVGLADEAAAREFLRAFASHLVRRLGAEVDQIEADIRVADPEVRHIDIELDAETGPTEPVRPEGPSGSAPPG